MKYIKKDKDQIAELQKEKTNSIKSNYTIVEFTNTFHGQFFEGKRNSKKKLEVRELLNSIRIGDNTIIQIVE